MVLCVRRVSTPFHDVDGKLITGRCLSYDGVVLTTWTILELKPVQIICLLCQMMRVVFYTEAAYKFTRFWHLLFLIGYEMFRNRN